MRVFVTGASGHIGSAVVPELLQAGHQVVGLARSDSSAEALAAAGAEVRRGDLDDLDGLREAAGAADGVIHLAFKHDLMGAGDFPAAIAADFAAIEALASALEGTGKPLVTSSGTLMLTFAGITGRPGTEADFAPGGPRVDAENFVIGLAGRGVRSSVVRLPPIVHSSLDHHGFAHILIGIARQAGRPACRGTWGTGPTGGPRCTRSTRRGCTGWPWRAPRPGAGCTRSRTRASPSVTSRPPSGAGLACLQPASPHPTLVSASPSSARSRGWTTRPPVR
jgi:nucleoside-diphosphate-sugar epimerase